MNFGPTELIIILVIVLLLFGGSKLPKLARSLGEASKEFKKGVDDGEATASTKEEGKDKVADKIKD
jgi:sec-independent protein translocase protein TatA